MSPESAPVVELRPGESDLTLMRDALRSVNGRLGLLTLTLTALGARAYQWATLLLVAGAFAYALVAVSWPRLAVAVAFTLLVHVPTYWRVPPAKE